MESATLDGGCKSNIQNPYCGHNELHVWRVPLLMEVVSVVYRNTYCGHNELHVWSVPLLMEVVRVLYRKPYCGHNE